MHRFLETKPTGRFKGECRSLALVTSLKTYTRLVFSKAPAHNQPQALTLPLIFHPTHHYPSRSIVLHLFHPVRLPILMFPVVHAVLPMLLAFVLLFVGLFRRWKSTWAWLAPLTEEVSIFDISPAPYQTQLTLPRI